MHLGAPIVIRYYQPTAKGITRIEKWKRIGRRAVRGNTAANGDRERAEPAASGRAGAGGRTMSALRKRLALGWEVISAIPRHPELILMLAKLAVTRAWSRRRMLVGRDDVR